MRDFSISSPEQTLSIAQAAFVSELPPKTINQMIDDQTLPADAFTKHNRKRFLNAFALPLVSVNHTATELLAATIRAEVVASMSPIIIGQWRKLIERPESAVGAHFKKGAVTFEADSSIRKVMTKLAEYNRAMAQVISDPNVRGGLPTLKGTRLGAEEIGIALESTSLSELQEDFPSLTPALADAASVYIKCFPRRGRPKKTGLKNS